MDISKHNHCVLTNISSKLQPRVLSVNDYYLQDYLACTSYKYEQHVSNMLDQ